MGTSAAEAALEALAAASQRKSGGPPMRVPAVGGDATEWLFLDRGGWEPLGLVSGASVFHVGVVGWPSGNTEVVQLSKAMYDAREKALTGLRDNAGRLGADGIVRTAVDVHFMEDNRHLPRFVATGTAVRQKQPAQAKEPGPKVIFNRIVGAGLEAHTRVLGTAMRRFKPLGRPEVLTVMRLNDGPLKR